MGNLENIAKTTRQIVFDIVCKNKAGHLASSLSSVEILTELYFGGVMRYDASEPLLPDRDRFILSKGHSALGYYVTLALAGYFPLEEIDSFCIAGTRYGGLPLRGKVKGVEATTGSLGHGISFAAGIAKAAKIKGMTYHTYCMLGDGECQEGSVWEAALFISQHKLNNLTLIIDNNRIQATGKTEDILNVESLVDKWRAFGFDTVSVNGHDFEALESGINICKNAEKPAVLIANTIKGKGVSYIENHEHWHYRMPEKEEESVGRKQLGFGE